MRFIVDIICPDGKFTKEEVEEMISNWFDKEQKNDRFYRVFWSVKEER